MERLTEKQIESALEKAEDWNRDGKWLQKRYKFKAFMDGIHYVDRIAELSEKVNHHPFISIDFRTVTLKLTSWQAVGITDLDFELTAKYDEIYGSI